MLVRSVFVFVLATLVFSDIVSGKTGLAEKESSMEKMNSTRKFDPGRALHTPSDEPQSVYNRETSWSNAHDYLFYGPTDLKEDVKYLFILMSIALIFVAMFFIGLSINFMCQKELHKQPVTVIIASDPNNRALQAIVVEQEANTSKSGPSGVTKTLPIESSTKL